MFNFWVVVSTFWVVVSLLWVVDARPRRKSERSSWEPGASEHGSGPRSWNQMTWNERWYLQEFWNGNLHQAMTDAEARCEPVAADPFRVNDDDDDD